MSEEIKVSDEAREVARREIKDYLGECLIPRGTANPQFHAAGRHIQLLLNQQIQLACLNWKHRDAALQTKIAALEAEVGELGKDKERLDWLSDSIPTFSIGAREKAGVVIFTDPCDFGGRNLREALDTALNSTKGEK